MRYLITFLGALTVFFLGMLASIIITVTTHSQILSLLSGSLTGTAVVVFVNLRHN